MTDINELRVRGTPALIAELEDLARAGTDTQELTEYAVAHGVELPEYYDSFQRISMAYDFEDGALVEHGLYWNDPDEPRAV